MRKIIATAVVMCVFCSVVCCKSIGIKLGIFKNKPPVWQRMSDEDFGFIGDFVNIFLDNSELFCPASIGKIDKATAFFEKNDGRKFMNGRIFRADSSLSLYVYKIAASAYNNQGDCTNARAYANKYVAMRKTDYLVMDILLTPEVYDPFIDAEIYEAMKGNEFANKFGYIETETCFTEKEYDEIAFPEGDRENTVAAARDRKNKVYDELKAGIKISEADEHFYWRFQELSAPAYNEIRNGDAEKGIKTAKEELEFLKKSEGREFAVGRRLKYESSLLLDAYANLMSGYGKKGDCGTAREYYDKYKSVAAGDYQIVDYFYFRVYDADADKEVYAEKKSRDLRIINESIQKNECFTPEEISGLAGEAK